MVWLGFVSKNNGLQHFGMKRERERKRQNGNKRLDFSWPEITYIFEVVLPHVHVQRLHHHDKLLLHPFGVLCVCCVHTRIKKSFLVRFFPQICRYLTPWTGLLFLAYWFFLHPPPTLESSLDYRRDELLRLKSQPKQVSCDGVYFGERLFAIFRSRRLVKLISEFKGGKSGEIVQSKRGGVKAKVDTWIHSFLQSRWLQRWKWCLWMLAHLII